MSATITVRRAVPADFDTLFQLYIDNGGGKIGHKRDLLRNGLRKLVSSPDLGFHIVAEAEGETVGMLRVAFEWSPYRDGTFWWVENVYVAPDWRRKGVYRAMHRHIHREAEEDPTICGIRLYLQGHAQAHPQGGGGRSHDLRHQAIHRRGQSRGAANVRERGDERLHDGAIRDRFCLRAASDVT